MSRVPITVVMEYEKQDGMLAYRASAVSQTITVTTYTASALADKHEPNVQRDLSTRKLTKYNVQSCRVAK
jgi:hypothetical protein